MSHFILPLTVESRKILFLDLFRPKTSTGEYLFSADDEYIAELPTIRRRTIISISRSKFIQSLHEKLDDFSIRKLGIELDFSIKEKLLTVKFSDTAPAITGSQQFVLGEGLVLHAITDQTSFYLELENLSHLDTLNPDKLRVCFTFSPSAEKQVSYGAVIQLCLVRTADILLTGYDFGSEASQIREGTFTHSGEGSGIDQHHIELFTDMKERLGNAVSSNNEYLQYEDRKLYKSDFFLRKVINADGAAGINDVVIPPDAVNVLTLITAKNNVAAFSSEWSQVPNLKLIHDNPDLSNGIQVSIDTGNRVYSVNLTSHRANVYAALLREMLLSYLVKRITSDIYLRFTLLVPNIYTAGQIKESKQIIRKIITDPANSFSSHIKGLEISTISESDASFLGYFARTKINPGDYYIVIDCGKGTTDISVVQSDESNAKAIRSIYRNGFAGAGNLVTFAVMESGLHFLKTNALAHEDGIKNFNAFVKPAFAPVVQADLRSELFKIAEAWKKNYTVERSKADIEEIWKDVRSGNIGIENLFSTMPTPEVVMSILLKPDAVYDWGGHIETAIGNIVEKIISTLAPVVQEMVKKGNCGGILLSGRGFMFKPLESAVASAIKNIKGLENAVIFDTAQFNLKEICLNGVFARSVLSYNEIVSTPIEIKKGELRKFKKSDIKRKGLFGGVEKAFRKLAGDEGESFDENLNKIVISNLDFANCQFLIGGNIYQPAWTGEGKFESAVLIRSREGFFIRATDDQGTVKILELEKVDAQNNSFLNKEFIAKSLFPGWSDHTLLNAIVNR